jgi:flavin reductase (DIM6/NTAB) family NADH-FMN oxidoreductase RutF
MSSEPGVAQFRQAMSMLAGAVNIIATGSTAPGIASWRGMTATAVCSVCAEPPSLLICLNRTTGTFQRIRAEGTFSVNVLTSRHIAVAQTFAGHDGLIGPDRFTDERWMTGRTGVPVLADALTSLECRVSRSIEHCTHALIIGSVEVIHHAPATGTAEPLVYHSRRFVELGRRLEEEEATT